MSAAAACTCLIWQVGRLIAPDLGSQGCFFSSLAGGVVGIIFCSLPSAAAAAASLQRLR
jgi:hypothetical protein